MTMDKQEKYAYGTIKNREVMPDRAATHTYISSVNPLDQMPKRTVAQAWQIARQLIAEFLGTGLLTYAIIRVFHLPTTPLKDVLVPLALLLGIWLAGPLSGGHVNPAVTLLAVLSRLMCPVYLPLYWVAQFLGAFCGAGLASVFPAGPVTPSAVIAEDPSIGLQFLAELVSSSIFLTILISTADSKRADGWISPGFTTATVIALNAFLNGSVMGPRFPVGFNPAASLSCAVVLHSYSNIYIRLFVPFLGSLLAAILFSFIITREAGTRRSRACLSRLQFHHADDFSQPATIGH